MTNFVSNIIWNSVEGFVEAGTRSAGGYAGDALIKAGDMIENYGRGVGNSVERSAAGYSTKIAGQGYTPPPPSLAKTEYPKKKALPASKKPAPKRSKSIATSQPSKVPLGANKYPGKQTGAAGTAAKSTVGGAAKKTPAAGNVGSTAKSTVGGATKTVGGVGNTAQKALPKPYPQKTTGGKELPKPYPQTSTATKNLPKPYNQTPTDKKYPGTDKKTAVKPGQKSGEKYGGGNVADPRSAPYPGTNTYPGTEKKTAVKARKYKPMERMKPPVEKGKVQHIGVEG